MFKYIGVDLSYVTELSETLGQQTSDALVHVTFCLGESYIYSQRIYLIVRVMITHTRRYAINEYLGC